MFDLWKGTFSLLPALRRSAAVLTRARAECSFILRVRPQAGHIRALCPNRCYSSKPSTKASGSSGSSGTSTRTSTRAGGGGGGGGDTKHAKKHKEEPTTEKLDAEMDDYFQEPQQQQQSPAVGTSPHSSAYGHQQPPEAPAVGSMDWHLLKAETLQAQLDGSEEHVSEDEV